MNDRAPHPEVRILIVEDSATQAFKLRHLLLRHFGTVTVAPHGAAALPMIEAEPPTLVISDVNMPEMDGYELCRRIKADARFAAIPVILITALTDASDVMNGLACGASGFLSKPCEEGHLLARIHFLLTNSALHRARRAPTEPGVEIVLGEQKYFIASGREQILDFLLSTYDLALQKNRELQAVSDRLAAQTRELERSNSDLEQFASVASHDLQEPLRMISSYLGLLERRSADKLDEKEKTFMNFAVDGAVRMQRMVSDLLAYSRVCTRAREVAPADLSAVLEAVLSNLEVARFETGAKITHDPLPTVSVDASQFTQLLQNLLGNALKFMPPGRAPEIHLGCAREGAVWRFSVRDNGIGITAGDFDRIFALFQRLHSRSEYAGTGIGLAVCKKIVERHGGRIWIESAVGEGTTFFFTVPAA